MVFFFKLINKCKLYVWVQDLWPENLQAINIIQNKFLLKIISYFSDKMYNLADVNIAQSLSFYKILKKRSSKKIFYLPNFSESFNFKKKIKTKKKSIITIMYAGNIGKAQNLQQLLIAAKYFLKNKKIIFKIFGDGFEYNKLRNLKKNSNLKNVLFFGNVSSKKLYIHYIQSDFLYLSLIKNKYLNYTIPAKLQTYMSFSKPIIASATGEVKKIIKISRCGFCANPGDVNSLIKIFLKVLNLSAINKKKLSLNSKNFYIKNFENKKIRNKLKKILN